ncbi:MAG: arylsulfatase A-like enzyme, partial [Pirellulaceae bacterium]
FLPGACQGSYIDTKNTEVGKLIENIRNTRLDQQEQRRQLDLVQLLNREHAASREDAQLDARINSFEMAYRMQSEAADVFDLSREPQYIRDEYGDTTNGRQLLLTRRLLERGVRFVQVWSGAGQPWDNHNDLANQHRKLGQAWDAPIAALLGDLKRRGMLDSTLVLWGGEFGRTPVAEKPALNGRDHNHYGFSCWLAGGGARGGYAHGKTDDFGFRSVEDRVSVHDLHATMLHLLGMDHKQLTYRYAGRDFRLTDVHGNVVKQLIG